MSDIDESTSVLEAPVISDELIFYPLSSPGMPFPGPDFIDYAVKLGDDRPQTTGKGKETKLVSCGPWLDQLYRHALYGADFTININVKGRAMTPTFIPGHVWGGSSYGPRAARVMALGKWPGGEEVQNARNMVGPSGMTLVQALEECGVSRDEYMGWYITNLVKHQQLDPSTSRIPVNQIKNCLPLLEQELMIVKPDYLLVMGAEATEHFFREKISVQSSMGRVLTRSVCLPNGVIHDIKVMCCLHPAAVARSPDRYPELRNTIARFGELIAGRACTEVLDDIDHRVIWSERELAKVVDDILAEKDNRNIAIDAEWHGDYPTEPGAWLRTIQFSHKPGFAVCVALRHQGGEPAFLPSIDAALPHLKRLLVSSEGRDVRIIGQNLRADLPWIIHLDKELGQTLVKQFDGPELPQDTKTTGGFDTMLAAHAMNETGDYKLEVMALNYCNVRRYDDKLQKWKDQECKALSIGDKELEGYGNCPDEVLHPYANWDADATQRLFRRLNDELLDKDAYGNDSRVPFWVSQRASNGFLEMEMTGVSVDKKRAEVLASVYMAAKSELTAKLQELLNWPTFNPYSAQQCRAALFGPKFSGKLNKDTGEPVDIRPEGARTLALKPVKTSGKPSKNWDKVVYRKEEHLYNPSTDKEVLGILCLRLFNEPKYEEVKTLRSIRFAGQVLKSVLCPPKLNADETVIELDDEGDWIFEKGLMKWVHSDSRVRTHLFQTKETGRASSARPPLQNLSKRREKDYRKILGDNYKYTLRSIIQTTPGWILVEADYKGAELLMMAIQSGDQQMIEHCMLANLPDGDPRQYDIHSNMAVTAFNLKVPELLDKKSGKTVSELLGRKVGDPLPPTKLGLELCGHDNLRTAAKTIMFGIPYGRGDEAIIRAVEEEGVKIDVEDARKIRDTIFNTYRHLQVYFANCQSRPDRPGWMRNCFGRYRRFPQLIAAQDGGAMGREAGNFPIQSGVADAISLAVHHLYEWPDRGDKFRILLQIHDALLFEVRPWFMEEFEGVLTECMTKRVAVRPCDLNGNPLPGGKSYHMETDVSVMLNWGEKFTREQGIAAGIPEKYLPKEKK